LFYSGEIKNAGGANNVKSICKDSMTLSKETRKHEIEGKTFVVKPVFKEESNENVTSILVKLIKSETP